MKNLDYRPPSGKKPWYKRWKVWGYTFGAIVLLGFILEVSGYNEKQAVIEAEEAAARAEEAAKKKAEKDAEREAQLAEIDAQIAEEERLAEEKAAEEAEKAVKVSAEKEQIDAEIRDSLQAIVDMPDSVVLDIKPSPYGDGSWETIWVVVSDAWYNSAEHEKERFAETVGDAVRFATNGEAMFVHFYDTYDKELAKEKVMGGYKIIR